MELNNSAGRLLAIMEAIRDAKVNENASCAVALPHVFPGWIQAVDSKASELLSIQFEINTLIDTVIEEAKVAAHDDAHLAICYEAIESIDRWRTLFSPDASLKNLRSAFTREIRMALVAMAQAIPEDSVPITEIDSDVQSLQRSVRKLVDEILEADELPKSLKQFLAEFQRASERLVCHFRIHGARGLRDVYVKIVGEMWVACSEDRAANTASRPWWSRVLKHLEKLDDIYGRSQKYHPFLGEATPAASMIFEKIRGFLS